MSQGFHRYRELLEVLEGLRRRGEPLDAEETLIGEMEAIWEEDLDETQRAILRTPVFRVPTREQLAAEGRHRVLLIGRVALTVSREAWDDRTTSVLPAAAGF